MESDQALNAGQELDAVESGQPLTAANITAVEPDSSGTSSWAQVSEVPSSDGWNHVAHASAKPALAPDAGQLDGDAEQVSAAEERLKAAGGGPSSGGAAVEEEDAASNGVPSSRASCSILSAAGDSGGRGGQVLLARHVV